MQRLVRSVSILSVGLALFLSGTPADSQIQIQVGPGGKPASNIAGGNLFVPDRQKTRALKQARTLVKNGDYKLSLKILQMILDLPEDSLFYDDIEDKTKFLSLKTEANRLIGSLPKEGRDAYELKFGVKARLLLSDALSAGNLRGVAEIARQYFHCQAGYKATYLLGSFEMDRGNPLAAALQYDRLRRVPKAARNQNLEPMLSLKTAVCWGRAGMPRLAIKTLVDLRNRSGGKAVTIGGKRVDLFVQDNEALPWLVAALGSQEKFQILGQEKWTMFRGNPSRTAVSSKASPVWDSLWSATTVKDAIAMDASPLKQLENVQKRLTTMEATRKKAGQLILPAAHPVIVGDLVISRSVRNLYAFNLKTGKLKWKSVADDPFFAKFLPQATSATPNATSTLDMLLTQRAWRDLTVGTLSSDGKFLYSVEEVGFVNTRVQTNSRTPTKTAGMEDFNSLMAFEVSTGKLKWQVGGSKQFDVPLAGMFFLGPPLPIGGRLFCLAEQNGEIRMVVIDPDNNNDKPKPKLLWSQPLIHPDSGVSRVAMRRMAGLSPSYSGGVLVCPTTAGAVVALDPARRLLLWGYRYKSKAEAATNGRNRMVIMRNRGGVQPVEEKDRWVDAAATIVDSRVILTPRDSDDLHCVSLIDGSLLWRLSRDGGLYVAAVHDGKVIIVGRNEIRAVGLRDGKPVWKQATPLPAPSGRGFQTDGYYHLPLSTGEIATVNLSSGRLVARSKTRSGKVLGNLVSANGAIVSQSIDRVVGFKPFDVLQSEVEKQMKANPNSPEALAVRGEMRLHSGDEDGGLKDLRRSIAIKASPRARALVVASLLEGLRLDFTKYRVASQEIERLLLDPDQKSRYLRIYAEGLDEVGEDREAFSKYLALAGPDTGDPKDIQISGQLTVRSDRWVQSRLTSIYNSAKASQKTGMDHEIQTQFEKALKENGPVALRKFLNCFSSLPKGSDARRELVDRLESDKAALEMEFLLQTLQQSPEPAVAGYATAKLAAILLTRNQHDAVARLSADLAGRFADVKCLDGKTGHAIAKQLQQTESVANVLKGQSDWPKKRIFAKRTSLSRTSYIRKYTVEFLGERGPFFKNWSFALDTRSRSFVATDANGKKRFTVSNTSSNYSYYGNSVKAHGHLLVVTLGNRFLVLDTLTASGTPKTLWSKNLYKTPTGPVVNRGIQVRGARMIGGRQRFIINGPQGQVLGMVGPVTDQMVVYQIAKTLYAADPLTGATLWKHEISAPGCRLFGDNQNVFVVPPQSPTQAIVIRSVDGAKVGQRTIQNINTQFHTHGRFVLNWRTSGNNFLLSYTDVFAEKIVWQKQFTGQAKIDIVKGEQVAVVEPKKGSLTVLDVKTGKTRLEGSIVPDTGISHIVIRRSKDRYVLLTYNAAQNPNNVRAMAIVYTSPMVNGYAYGFDRKTGKRVWTTMIDQQSIELGQPENLPVLVLAARLYVNQQAQPGGIRRSTYYQLSVDVLDVRNGHIIYGYKGTESVYPYDLTVDPVKKTINLAFYRSNVALTMSASEAIAKPNRYVKPTVKIAKPAGKKVGAANPRVVPIPVNQAPVINRVRVRAQPVVRKPVRKP